MYNSESMDNFLDNMDEGNGFTFLSDYESYGELSKDELRCIAKEAIYAMEKYCDKSIIENIRDTMRENLGN